MAVRLLLGTLLVSVLTACGGAPATSLVQTATSPSPAGSSPATSGDACPVLEPQHLPGGVHVDAAYVCGAEIRDVPGDGEWQFSTVRRVTGGLDALLEAYGEEDQPPGPGGCTLELPDPRVVWLHDGDSTLAVRAPVDACHKPTVRAQDAHRALTLQEVSSVKQRQVTTQQAIDSHCADSYKDMLAMEEEFGGPRRQQALPDVVGRGARLCLYDVVEDAEGDRIGRLRGARTLSDDDVTSINAELQRSVEDATCSRHEHRSFALLVQGDAGAATLLALDGCAVQQDGGWWRATSRLRDLVSTGER